MNHFLSPMAWARGRARIVASASCIGSERFRIPQIVSLLALCLLGLAFVTAAAQGYPDRGRVNRIVAPTRRGSALDLLTRSYRTAMAKLRASMRPPRTRRATMTICIKSFLGLPLDGNTIPFCCGSYGKLRVMTGFTYIHELLDDFPKNFVHEPIHLVGDEVTAMNRQELETSSKLVREHGIKFAD